MKRDNIQGSRRISNYWWAVCILSGGLGFFLAGLSSYLNLDLLPFTQSSELLFIPQGIIMTFYGTIALVLSSFLWLTIIWDVGSGYNLFDIEKGIVIIFRLGFPGKNRIVQLRYPIGDIKSIKVRIQDGLTPKREIYLRTKDNREIPLNRIGEPLKLSDLEQKATELARLLGVVLEGI
uniref:Photosystem I assembly protein Ycf4 n=1 Tax=Dichotomaria marginata TaxID=268567 RepID=A0A1G4NS81_9FLOR|nr:Photosystem I assembly protein Ycf4 [Dichotomaria marginata]SCW21531.1 Photosystem I assembly protein Ycf4 [Dichotomaria marginata]